MSTTPTTLSNHFRIIDWIYIVFLSKIIGKPSILSHLLFAFANKWVINFYLLVAEKNLSDRPHNGLNDNNNAAIVNIAGKIMRHHFGLLLHIQRAKIRQVPFCNGRVVIAAFAVIAAT